MSDRIAIIGMAGVFPQAADLNTYWHNITHKVDTITDLPPTHWRAEDYFHPDHTQADHVYTTKGGFIPALTSTRLNLALPPNNLPAIDSAQLLGLLVAKEALLDAGYGAARDLIAAVPASFSVQQEHKNWLFHLVRVLVTHIGDVLCIRQVLLKTSLSKLLLTSPPRMLAGKKPLSQACWVTLLRVVSLTALTCVARTALSMLLC